MARQFLLKSLLKTKADVIVTFLADDKHQDTQGQQKIVLGMLEGKIKLSDDFDEPLDDLKEYV